MLHNNKTVIDVTSLLHLLSCCINHNISATRTQPYGTDGWTHQYTCFAWAGGTFFPVVLLCCISFWFWWEKGFDLHTHVLLRVQYSCGGGLVIWFWWEIDFDVMHILSVQYSCAVVSVFSL